MNQKGFSLIEVSLAIAIITIGLITIISLFIVNIRNEIRSKNKLIAVYLANESIEIIRQQRDNNWFSGIDWMGVDWMTDIPTGDVAVVPRDVDDIRIGWDVVTAAAGANERKVFLTGSNIYLNDAAAAVGAVATGFERYLTINTGTAGCLVGAGADCMEVTAHVSFGGVQLAEVTTYFYDGWF